MKGIQRIISSWLAVCMVFSMLPVQALADDVTTEETTVTETTVETTVATEPEETVPEEKTVPVQETTSAEETNPEEEIIPEEMPVWETEYTTVETLEIPGVAPMMGTTDADLTWVLDSNGKLTITGTGAMSYDIPWKAYNSQITEIVIGEGITSISDSAFYECFNLTSVSLPSTLKTIGYFAFYRCLKLESIPIPASVTNIYTNSFDACTAMTGIWVDEANETYSSDTNGILFNKDKTELLLCPKTYSGRYEIPAGVVTVGNNAFDACTALTAIEIPASVATIGSSAFQNCDSLTTVVIPGNVVSLGNDVFAYCANLSSVTFENGLVSIGGYAFYDCNALTDVQLPDTLVSISQSCFSSCDTLKRITIPRKVSHIDYNAFGNCPLDQIKFEGNAPVIENNAFYHYSTRTITASYPAGDDTWTEEVFNGSYGTTFNWVSYEPDVQEEEETPLYIVAQGSCGTNVSWMIMSDGRLIIFGKGSMQFMMRSGAAPWSAYADLITSIEVTSGIESIADNAFSDCTNVTTVSVADTVTSIGAEAFVGCESLETVTFAGDAPEIGENCFENVEAVIEYPVNNDTWTEEVQENFGSNMTWESIEHIHSYDIARQDATCMETGSVTMKCECGETEVQTLAIDPENHTDKNTIVGKADATCGAEGYTGDTVCECGVTVESGEVIPATGKHVYDQEIVDAKYLVSEATTTSLAVYRKSCKCGAAGEETFTAGELKAPEFMDVPGDAYYHDPVMWAVEKKITNGVGDGTIFAPDSGCTRGQIATFLWRAAGEPVPKSTEMPFKDVPTDEYFSTAVIWAAENGITTGTGDGTIFEPNATCTRGQIVTFLSRYLKGTPSNDENPFKDVPNGEYYTNAVLWAVENGITNGVGDGTVFEPDSTCTRGMIVTFLYRALYP